MLPAPTADPCQRPPLCFRASIWGLLGAVAEFERSMILERQREGIAIAKAAGKYKGRKASLSQTQASELRGRLAKGESVTALATEYGVSRQTIYNCKIA